MRILSEYCTVGGFPEYIQTGIDEILEALIDDIITETFPQDME